MRPQLALLVGGSSVTAHCHAATARPTREYQGEHLRTSLPSVAICVARPLDKSFHIRRSDSYSAERETGLEPATFCLGSI
jgi:hypothetical protein